MVAIGQATESQNYTAEPQVVHYGGSKRRFTDRRR
jgi:hypothetical protein